MPFSPPPQSSQVIDQGGRMTPYWSKWFRDVYAFIGSATSRTLAQLDTDLSTAAADITALEAVDTTQAALIAAQQNQINALLQGRQL